jgi:hypothetical protein
MSVATVQNSDKPHIFGHRHGMDPRVKPEDDEALAALAPKKLRRSCRIGGAPFVLGV